MLSKSKRLILLTIPAVSALLLGGCFVEVSKYHEDPEKLFAEAQKDLDKALAGSAGGRPSPNDLHILVYEKDSRELVRIRIPFWLLAKIDGKGASLDIPREFKDRGWANRDKIRVTLEDLKNMGPGMVLRINDDDSRVMVWLK